MRDPRVYIEPKHHGTLDANATFHCCMVRIYSNETNKDREKAAIDTISELCKQLENLKKENVELIRNARQPQRLFADLMERR